MPSKVYQGSPEDLHTMGQADGVNMVEDNFIHVRMPAQGFATEEQMPNGLHGAGTQSLRTYVENPNLDSKSQPGVQPRA